MFYRRCCSRVCVCVGITQDRIEECRGVKEAAMLADVRALVQGGEDLNARDDNGAALVRQGRVRKICSDSFCRDEIHVECSSQLHIASANGYLSVAELLLEHRAQVEVKDTDGWTPLHAASCWGHVSACVPTKTPDRPPFVASPPVSLISSARSKWWNCWWLMEPV